MKQPLHRLPVPRRGAAALFTVLALGLSMLPAPAADPLATWHVRQPPRFPTRENFEGITYGNGRWVVLGEDGTLLSSTDGTRWEEESNPSPGSGFHDVAFGNGRFVVVGNRPDQLLTSPDGRRWTPGQLGLSGAREIIHDGSRFVVLASGGYLAVSTNGLDWEARPRVPMKFVDAGGIAFGRGTYVEVGYMRTGRPTDLFSSSDLVTWTPRDARSNENLMNVAFGLNLFVAVGQDGVLITSPDGAEWTPRDSRHSGFIWDLACDGRRFVAAAQWGRLLVSDDGIDWTRHETGLPWHLTDIAFGHDSFVAVGWDGQIVQSDPVEPAPSTDELRLVLPRWRDGRFSFSFDADLQGTYEIQSSEDGATWTPAARLVATSDPMSVVDLQASVRHRCYRVRRVE